ncbi:MAG: hypothetical protein IT523_09410, partial [Burkholderiales bacterium]|nr:hypothetical protein [Burkholderiales bacterium]
ISNQSGLHRRGPRTQRQFCLMPIRRRLLQVRQNLRDDRRLFGNAHRDSVNDLTGVPPDTRVHFKVYAERGEASGKVLIVHFFERSGRRQVDRMRPGRLGFSLMTHACDDLDALAQRPDAGRFGIVVPPTRIRTGYDERRVLLATGPNEELLEFVQAN